MICWDSRKDRIDCGEFGKREPGKKDLISRLWLTIVVPFADLL